MELNISDNRCDYYRFINASETDWRYLLLPTALENVILTYIYPIIIILGVSGNMCFLIMMARFRQMRSTVNYYLTSLAIADLMILIIEGAEKLIPYHTTGKYTFLPHGFLLHLYVHYLRCSFLYFIVSHYDGNVGNILRTLQASCTQTNLKQQTYIRLLFLSWFAGIIFGLATKFPLWVEIMYICLIWPENLLIFRNIQ